MTDRKVSPRAERARAQAQSRRRKEARRRQLTIGGVVLLVVVVVVGAMVAVKLTGGGKKKASTPTTSSTSSGGLSSAVSSNLSSVPIKGVPADVLKQLTPPQPVKGQSPLTKSGKPEVLYVGAEFCPFCAAERWPLVVALERFGDFSGLAPTTSSSTDQYPDTPTLTFLHSTYTSDYLSFVSYEDRDREGNPLQKVHDDVSALMTKIGDKQGSIPFIDYGNAYFTQGASYNPQILASMSQAEVARAAAQHADQLPGAAIDAVANNMTAVLCKLTNGKPANVCTDPAITAIQQKLGS